MAKLPHGINKTAIEWCDCTWNPITGCLNNCPYCYARRIATRFAGTPAFPEGFKPTIHRDRLKAPYYMKGKGNKVFVCSMGELFMDNYENWTEDVLRTIEGCPDQTFILLTKQAQNLWQWSPFPDNCWVGVSATCESEVVDACRDLCHAQAPVKFLSIEPLLRWDRHKRMDWFAAALALGRIGWVIIGAQTQPYRPPAREAVLEIFHVVDKEGIPLFLKNNLKQLLGTEQLRQEWPE
jgi:protein gp37